MASRPLIALAGRRIPAEKAWRDDKIGSPAPYLEAIETAGGVAAILAPTKLSAGAATARLARFDGLLLIGGADVDPSKYGQPAHTSTYGVDPGQDDFELALLAASDQLALPTLCICRGLQLLNVGRGGTLTQHLGDHPQLADHGRPGAIAGERALTVLEGSLLAEAWRNSAATLTRCYHHQAVDIVAPTLRVIGRADDGVVEALELAEPEGRWLLGVQWHPEDSASKDPAHQAIFDAFVANCHR